MTSVLIIEPNHAGHIATYLGWVVRAAVEQGFQIRLATLRSALESDPRMRAIRGNFGGKVEILPCDFEVDSRYRQSPAGFLKLIRREFVYRSLLGRMFRRATEDGVPDRVFVPYVDYCTYAVALRGPPFGGIPWSGIVVRPSFHYRSMGILAPRPKLALARERLFLRLLQEPSLSKLFTVDPTLARYVERKCASPERRKLCYLPDPAEFTVTGTRSESRRLLGIPAAAKVILVYGELRARKGVDCLLAAMADSDVPRDVHVLLAGRHFPEMYETLGSAVGAELTRRGRLHQLDTVLAPEDEFRVFAAADIVWMGYRGHYNMSGVLVQAGKMKLPVIACQEGMIGALSRAGVLGPIVDPSEASSVVGAIRTLCEDPVLARRYGANAGEFFADCTPAVFSKTICEALETPGELCETSRY